MSKQQPVFRLRAGAVLLALNVISFAAHHYLLFGAASNPGVFVYSALFAERLGFKLAWGCLVFYPFFYVAIPPRTGR